MMTTPIENDPAPCTRLSGFALGDHAAPDRTGDTSLANHGRHNARGDGKRDDDEPHDRGGDDGQQERHEQHRRETDEECAERPVHDDVGTRRNLTVKEMVQQQAHQEAGKHHRPDPAKARHDHAAEQKAARDPRQHRLNPVGHLGCAEDHLLAAELEVSGSIQGAAEDRDAVADHASLFDRGVAAEHGERTLDHASWCDRHGAGGDDDVALDGPFDAHVAGNDHDFPHGFALA